MERRLTAVICADIVGYSKALTDEQQELIDRLNQAVRSSDEFQKAAAEDRLIKIPTGDGMALIFYSQLVPNILLTLVWKKVIIWASLIKTV